MKTNKMDMLTELFDQIEPNERNILSELAVFAMENNYNPTRNKTSNLSFDFKNNKTKQTLMKIELKALPKSSENGNKIVPGLRLKFYASKDYSIIFQNAIKKVIEAFNGKYTGCYGCGRCKKELRGYIYTYDDGKKVYRCGSELIDIPNFQDARVEEIKKLMKNQIIYWENEGKE